MKSMLRIFSYTALLGSMLMVAGCGDGTPASPTLTKVTKVTAATVNPDGKTVTTTADVYAATVPIVTAGTVSNNPAVVAAAAAVKHGIMIPQGTVITAKDANGAIIPLSVPFVINVSTPVDGVSGLPPQMESGVIVGKVATVAGAVDVTIPGARSVTFTDSTGAPAPVTITIPLPLSTVAYVSTTFVRRNKNDGNGWKSDWKEPGVPEFGDLAPYTLVGLAVPVAASVTTTDLCWFAIDVTINSGSTSQ
ncbi:MAG: hypothetical protein WA140_11990 [Geobacteraceae bacterium]